MNEVCKFDQLRIKTDSELVHVITHELDLGLRAAAMNSYTKASRAYFEAARLLRIAKIAPEAQARLETMLERLGAALQALADAEFAGCLVA